MHFLNRYRLGLSAMVCATAMVMALIVITGLIEDGQYFGGENLAHRLQTEAFFKGKLSLQNHPFGHPPDYIWANGLQQSWGLGIPILRMPFEAIAKLFGYDAAPDRLVLLFYYWCAAAVLYIALYRFLRCSSDTGMITTSIQTASLTTISCLPVVVLAMLSSRLLVYEEVITYIYIWNLLTIGLLVLLLLQWNTKIFLLACLCAGFVLLIRPTGLFYTVAYAVLLLCIAGHHIISRSTAVVGGLLFSLGSFVQLISNKIRFGGWFDFGILRHNSFIPPNMFSTRFQNPVADAGFMESIRELSGMLFNVVHVPILSLEYVQQYWYTYRSTGHGWETDAFRLRELLFDTFPLWLAPLYVIALAVCFYCGWKYYSQGYSHNDTRRVLGLLGVWSILAFGISVVFYLRTAAIASRYCLDFAPALLVPITFVGGYLSHYFTRTRLMTMVMLVIATGWVGYGVANAERTFILRQVDEVVTYSRLQEIIHAAKAQMVPGILPDRYRCKVTTSNYGIPVNVIGWNINSVSDNLLCRTSVLTNIFFSNLSCVQFTFRTRDGSPFKNNMQVMVNADKWQQQSLNYQGGVYTTKFCPITPHEDDALFHVVSTSWVGLEDLHKGTSNIYLIEVSNVSR